MGVVTGRRLALSLPRRFIGDLLRASSQIPVVTFERRMDLAPVVSVRRELANPPAWSVLLAKGFAIVAAHRPEFRRTYVPLPWPRLWEVEESVASIAVERNYVGEPGVFFGTINAPNRQSLTELSATLDGWKNLPVEEVQGFRRVLKYARFPLPLRRLLWWYVTSWSGKVKVRNLGTFGVSLTGSAGATATNLICPLTTSLNCGTIEPDGRVDVRLHFDHRVLDGMPVARALVELEEVLRTTVTSELETMVESGPSLRGIGRDSTTVAGAPIELAYWKQTVTRERVAETFGAR